MIQSEKTVVIPLSCSRRPVILSVVAPVFAVGFYMANATLPLPYSWCSSVLVAGAMVLIWAGLLAAIISLVNALRYKGINTALYAITAFLLNSCILASAFGIELPFIYGVAGRSDKIALLQLNAAPQVYDNSVTVIDAKRGFRFELPAGFIENQGPKPSAMTIHSYLKESEKKLPKINVNIERLRRILPANKSNVSADELGFIKKEIQKISPYAVFTRTEHGQWNSHKVGVYLFEMPEKGEMISTWITKISSPKESILIKVSGIKGSEGQYRQTLTYILKTFRGTSKWD